MVANLNNGREEMITGNDNIVIVDNFQSIRGGRTLVQRIRIGKCVSWSSESKKPLKFLVK